MKTAIRLIVSAAALAAAVVLGIVIAGPVGSAVNHPDHEGHADEGAEQLYTCGMHPQVRLADPDAPCPICGMSLVPVSSTSQADGVTIDARVVQNIGVRTAEVTTGPLLREIRTVGSVVVDETRVADVNARFGGFVETLAVAETGVKVEADQPLLTAYSPEVFAAADEYRLALGGANEAVINAGRRRLELLGLSAGEISRLGDEGGATVTLRSPLAGTVLEKSVLQGQELRPGQRLYRVADLSRVWVEAVLYEDDLALVRVGQPAAVTLASLPGRTLEGEVTLVSPTVDPMTRQATARVELANDDGLLRPGQYAHVRIDIEAAPEATLVPREAVLETGDRQVVMLDLGDGRYSPRNVTLGHSASEGRVEVLDGLDAGDRVVTSGQFLLDSEANVQAALAAGDDDDDEPVADDLPAEALDPAVAGPIVAMLRPYLEIADALSRDALDGVAASAEEVVAAANDLAAVRPSFAAEPIAAKQADLASDDIATVRRAFSDISGVIVPLARETGVPATLDDELQAVSCPMFPPGETSPWLQPLGEPRNPYMGEKMLRCRDEQTPLPMVAVAEGGPS